MPEQNDDLERDLRAALQPHRVDPAEFLNAVETKVKERERSEADGELTRAAASVLPLGLFGFAGASHGALEVAGAVKASSTLGHKFLALLSWPAASVFVLLGVSVFGVRAMRHARQDAPDAAVDPTLDDLNSWWRRHRMLAAAFWVATLLPMVLGSSFYVLCVLNFSAIALLIVTRGFTKAGLGSRDVIGAYCCIGLFYLGIPLMFLSGPLMREQHVVDPRWLPVVFLMGAAFVPVLPTSLRIGRGSSRPLSRTAQLVFRGLLLSYSVYFGAVALGNATFDPKDAVVSRVESFDHAEFGSASWKRWAILSSWAHDKGYELDLSKPRAVLARALEEGADPYTLASAMRGGLVREVVESPSIDWAEVDAEWERWLGRLAKGAPLRWRGQGRWRVRAAFERDILSAKQRDLLIGKIHERIQADPRIEEVAQLIETLDLLGDDTDAHLRPSIHRHLREHWDPEDRSLLVGGGFGLYAVPTGSDPGATFIAIRLMNRFGVPEGIDLNRVDWYLRHESASTLPFLRSPRQLVAAVALESFEPLAPPVTLARFLQLERSLIGAVILVLLCYYATLSAPKPVRHAMGDLSEPKRTDGFC